MKSNFSILSNPYYFNPSLKFKLKASFLVGLFIFLFIYFFKPFNINKLSDIILEYAFFLGAIAVIGAFLLLYVPPLLFKTYFNEDNWTIKKNIIFICISIFLIGSCAWYLDDLYKNTFDIREIYGIKKLGYLSFLRNTFLVVAIPLLIFIFLNEKNIRVRRIKRANKINSYNNEKVVEKILKKQITIYSENKKEKLIFNINDLVYITSEGNYASFFIMKNAELKEKILRVTLAKISEDLKEYTTIIRCHKSYIVNINYINDILGNARGYLLKSDIITFEIPVSRSFSKQSLKSMLN